MIALDSEVNQTRFDIEEKCFGLIVTQQPAARDLRSIVTVMNISGLPVTSFIQNGNRSPPRPPFSRLRKNWTCPRRSLLAFCSSIELSPANIPSDRLLHLIVKEPDYDSTQKNLSHTSRT